MKKLVSRFAAGMLAAVVLLPGCGSSQTGTVYIMGDAKLKLEVSSSDTVKAEEGLNQEANSLMTVYSGMDKPIGEAAAGYITQMAETDQPGQMMEINVLSDDSDWAETMVGGLKQDLQELARELDISLVIQTVEDLNDSDILQELEEESRRSAAESSAQESESAEAAAAQSEEQESESEEESEESEEESEAQETEPAAEETTARETEAVVEETAVQETEPAVEVEAETPTVQPETVIYEEAPPEAASISTQETTAAVPVQEFEAAPAGETDTATEGAAPADVTASPETEAASETISGPGAQLP